VTLKQIRDISLDGFSTGKRPRRCNLNRVCGIQCPDSGCVVLVECFIKLQIDSFKPLNYLGTRGSIARKGKGLTSSFFLAKAARAELLANPIRITAWPILIGTSRCFGGSSDVRCVLAVSTGQANHAFGRRISGRHANCISCPILCQYKNAI
jgi:hypothetical protein